MSSKRKRVPIVVAREVYERWKEFSERRYDGNMNQMVRDSVRKNIKQVDGEEKSDLDPIMNSLDGLHSAIQQNKDILQALRIRINAEDGDSKSYEAANRILDLLLEKRYTPSELVGKLDYIERQCQIYGHVGPVADLHDVLGTCSLEHVLEEFDVVRGPRGLVDIQLLHDLALGAQLRL
ncbi:hypothetical protein AKJ62_03650 [candidate division MSBL1 archaeon SCGC-AAA259D14]|uniref:Uncharacterized protein n=1 Tax=candidate division MSBL1 archaeon SCGC-AAA259D14 TaxID=1698261 RepID=A0A133U4Q1_9EURY|nr:hypothetical protein AKJ62_03650 [candidate division MSBL1 archaeon SCGC-AAA259D14]